ncbi:APC family permease [Truepera radiovictrix]|uniref:Amino acid permease-associated region n=1 Tax=Truepera radiovictrix (strain DSM 17093 / CIP 108686 / LMG 22925 / RQ-24) TaxID=649638 RepID=D7CT67_TRURR|nr:APC family permease [Truepera radiovictrix]ADI15530.1 amino acid permease-associated region [Truepera radiovictrix DSM 17093]WMT55919.1 APC family permease [Truepera radiovictrix]
MSKRSRVNKGATSEGSFSRTLHLPGAIAVGLGTMLGAGIFVLSADAAQRAGPGAVVSFLLAGLIVLPTAMVVSELATAMPQEGGSYHLVSRTLGPVAGAVVGPANWLGLIFAGGFYLVGLAQFVTDLAPLAPWIVIVGGGALFTALNYFGAKLTGRLQVVIVALLVLLLGGFVTAGLFQRDPDLHTPFLPFGWSGVLSALGLIIVSFTGFEKISTVAGEVRRPERNLPRAIIGSVVLATLLYAAVLYALTGLVPTRELGDAETALVTAAARLLGTFGRVAMLLGGLLATASSVNAAVLAASRIGYAMGRDDILPAGIATLEKRRGTPYRAVLITGGLATALALTGTAPRLAEVSSALFMVSYALLAASVIAMRRFGGEAYRPAFRVPFAPWLPALGGLAALAVIATMDTASQLTGLGLVLLSLVWYALWGRARTTVKGKLGS